jgi:hypothetical protein
VNALVIDRGLSFAELLARLNASGWQRTADPSAPSPIIEGEPEIAEFTRGELRLLYTFEPASGLRVLRSAGPHCDDALPNLASRLPSRGSEHARALLHATDTASRLLGLRMIDALDARSLIGEVAALTRDADATIAQQAMRIGVRLIAEPAAAALRAASQWKREHPDRSPLFLLTGSTHNKLQIVRWLAHNRRESNDSIDAVLRTALADPDWELRLSALVVAARLRASNLLDDVMKTALPQDTADGLNTDERRMARTIQLCAVELSQGAAVPPPSVAPPITRETMHAHLLRCVAGEPVAHADKVFLFLTSLVTPLPDKIDAPIALPRGIRIGEDGYLLESASGDIALCWVPPVEHWLGDELPRMRIANPIRKVSGTGFFISRAMGATPERVNYDAALDHCERLGAETQLRIRLPTCDEWEMAARGPDGRRFPWGNNARSEARFGASPWGLSDAVGRVAQWTSNARDPDVLVCGGEKQWVCAMHEPSSRNALCAMRFVIEIR